MGKGGATKDAILDRAVRLVSQVGLSGLSIGRLAEDLHMSKSGLFAHFQAK
ncbi:MAG TPA: helix-turn-helix domain-containing protein, partial [Thermoanaerobaculia bacterium]|nr:helix-turn-helix domain-containing protein [Thermoanaerobaculia bacterium]